MHVPWLPELMPELVPVSEGTRRRLPRWDPRLWGDGELLELAPRRTRSSAELRELMLGWARAHARRQRPHLPHAGAHPACNDATPPIRAQQAPAVEHRTKPALASTDLGGVGGPQAAPPHANITTPQSDAAEDRRRWATPAYLSANGMRLARLDYEPPAKGEPLLASAPTDYNHTSSLHVFLELPDHLGSESITIDQASGELVEARTYQPYGATESDYRPDRWKGFREDYGFTGKEEDVEVGLQYFGKRFLSPYLGRWISADPLAVHAPGSADLNLYAYVHGGVLKNVDPLGLEEDEANQVSFEANQSDAKTGQAADAAGHVEIPGPTTAKESNDATDDYIATGKQAAAFRASPQPAQKTSSGATERQFQLTMPKFDPSFGGAPGVGPNDGVGGATPNLPAAEIPYIDRSQGMGADPNDSVRGPVFSLGTVKTGNLGTGVTSDTVRNSSPAKAAQTGFDQAEGFYIAPLSLRMGMYVRTGERYGTGASAGVGVEASFTKSMTDFKGDADNLYVDTPATGSASVYPNGHSVSLSPPQIGTSKGAAAGYEHSYTVGMDWQTLLRAAGNM